MLMRCKDEHDMLVESAKVQFSARAFSDHLALVRAFDGWKDAEKEQSGYEYCWRNFLSAQTLKAIDSLRKQFLFLLKDIGLVENIDSCNAWSHDEHLIRAVVPWNMLCCGVGLVGNLASMYPMKASKVILNDGDFSILANMKVNLELNHLNTESRTLDNLLHHNMVHRHCVCLPWDSASEDNLRCFASDIITIIQTLKTAN